MEGFMTYERVRTPEGDSFRTVGEQLPDEILVLDTETTGLKGAPRDLVVDIGICRVSVSEGIVDDLYSSVLGYDTTEWDDYLKEAWIFQNTDLTLDMVESAPSALHVIDEVRRILRRRAVTSYNTGYDFGKFLYEEPWSMRGWFVECSDIMRAATDLCRIPSEHHPGSYRYPRLDVAYSRLVRGDPAGIHGRQDHRALSDARMASHVLLAMHASGHYRPRSMRTEAQSHGRLSRGRPGRDRSP